VIGSMVDEGGEPALLPIILLLLLLLLLLIFCEIVEVSETIVEEGLAGY